MASFHGKIGWKRQRKRESKNYRSITFLPNRLEKIPIKKQKNSKNTIIATIQAKIGWKRLGKRENKNYRSTMFLPNRLEKIPKNNNEIQKIQLWHHFKPKQVGKE